VSAVVGDPFLICNVSAVNLEGFFAKPPSTLRAQVVASGGMCRWQQFRWATLGLAAMSACSALATVTPIAAKPVAIMTGLVALGPASGWWIANSRGELGHALSTLLTGTLLPVAAAIPWLRESRHSGCLGLATLLWYAIGWYR
jgi:hypothetical protein